MIFQKIERTCADCGSHTAMQDMADGYQSQLSRLQTTDDYLSRSSEVQLLLAGAWQGSREAVGQELKQLPIGDLLAQGADQVLSGLGASSERTAANLEEQGKDMLSNLATARLQNSVAKLGQE